MQDTGIVQREESIMSKVTHVRPEVGRIAAPLKAAAIIVVLAVVALIVVSVDTPRSILALDAPPDRMADVFLAADGPAPGPSIGAQVPPVATAQAGQHAAAMMSK
jgi:hypothetical protein